MPERRHRVSTVTEGGSFISEPSLLLGQGEGDALTRCSFSGAGKCITEAFSAGVMDVASSTSMASLVMVALVEVVVVVMGSSPSGAKGVFVNILVPVYVRCGTPKSTRALRQS